MKVHFRTYATCFMCVVTLSINGQSIKSDKGIEKIFETIQRHYLYGESSPFKLISKETIESKIPNENEARAILSKIAENGHDGPRLEKVNVDPSVIKSKVLPSPKREEGEKYLAHGMFLDDLYQLARFCATTSNKKLQQEIEPLIVKRLEWYMDNYAPERAYWRLTMRFGTFRSSHLATPILAQLDRILICLYDYILREAEKGNLNPKQLAWGIVDYTDYIIDEAVGAQNRGVNWRARFNHIVPHFLLKYQLGGQMALNQLKYHLYDGFEYDPRRHYSGGMGTLTDGGFWHHGAQAYCLPYGKGDFLGSVGLMKMLEGTKLAFKERHYETYQTQMLDKWQYVVYEDEWFDLGIVGGKNAAQVSKIKAKISPGTLLDMINEILALDSQYLSRHDELITLRNNVANKTHDKNLSETRSYWKWEYLLHRRPGWYIGYKGLSNLTKSSEWDQNYHLSSGHMPIMQRGGEYWKVRPALRWSALPGVTAEQFGHKTLNQKMTTGTSRFCNGTTDGRFGLFAFDLGHANTSIGTVEASKAGFFVDQGAINLTSGIRRISGGQNKEIWTSLDNRILNGDIVAFINGEEQKLNHKKLPHDLTFELKDNGWFWHDGIAYFIPVNHGETVHVRLIVEERSGDVKEVLKHNKSKAFRHKTFLLAINHGKDPENAKASYMVFPSVPVEFIQDNDISRYAIISNTDHVQAVLDKQAEACMIVFKMAGQVAIEGFGTVSSTRPMLATLVKDSGKLRVSISDPIKFKKLGDTALDKKILLTLGVPIEGEKFNVKNGQTTLHIKDDNGGPGYEGKPIVREYVIQ
ncbi:MAG: polysaccharide lyase beta-sandwich domain-containing protein [Flavobacteriaceae bacterium]|nr:polysaccharide lyase beta-sandwich domain-containing protein [Flavobacteriaceae bacterium]MCY4216063.1 polysaccharide lyase beta-sandwich domain-containing protein [Flavobacteriaceae bacterium]